jgi:hypothetical protein
LDNLQVEKGKAVIGRTGQGNLLDLLVLREREGGGTTTGKPGVQRIKAILVEVIDYRTHPVRAGESI